MVDEAGAADAGAERAFPYSPTLPPLLATTVLPVLAAGDATPSPPTAAAVGVTVDGVVAKAAVERLSRPTMSLPLLALVGEVPRPDCWYTEDADARTPEPAPANRPASLACAGFLAPAGAVAVVEADDAALADSRIAKARLEVVTCTCGPLRRRPASAAAALASSSCRCLASK